MPWHEGAAREQRSNPDLASSVMNPGRGHRETTQTCENGFGAKEEGAREREEEENRAGTPGTAAMLRIRRSDRGGFGDNYVQVDKSREKCAP